MSTYSVFMIAGSTLLFRLYNWSAPEAAFFPRETLQEELESRKTSSRRSESNWKTKWERKLFYWMPFCGMTYGTEHITKSSEDTVSLDSGEESPC